MARQELDIPAMHSITESTHAGWLYVISTRPQIDSVLTPPGANRYFANVTFFATGAVQLSVTNAPTGQDVNNQDLSDTFESSGVIRVVTSLARITVALDGADPSEPYDWTPSNSAAVTAFVAALENQVNGTVPATLTISDGPLIPTMKYNGVDISEWKYNGIDIAAAKYNGIDLQ